jgi:8-oxo-dGTP pyrophosphatase MutT (NUDIX family)
MRPTVALRPFARSTRSTNDDIHSIANARLARRAGAAVPRTDVMDKSVWREVAREPVADCRVFKVERSIAASPIDGQPRAFYRLTSPDWAQVVPITPAGEVVLVRQFRHGSGQWTLEIPGGLVDPGEEPAQAALRECLEETGYRASGVSALGAVNPNPALFGNRLHAFIAHDAQPAGAIQNTASEQTEVVLVPVSELRGLLLRGEIDHGLVAGTLWRFLHEHAPR